MGEKVTVKIKYKNYRGEISNRNITPFRIRFTVNKYHTERQWLLTAYDHGKEDMRFFAVKDILKWEVLDD